MTDLSVEVYDGSFHEVDSSEVAFKIAASKALQEAAKKADLTLLEPIMKVEVTTPSEFLGDVIGDLSAKEHKSQELIEHGKATIVNASVPLFRAFRLCDNSSKYDSGKSKLLYGTKSLR